MYRIFIGLIGLTGALATSASAQVGIDLSRAKAVDLVQCSHALGRVAIHQPQIPWWQSVGLSSPDNLLGLMASKSGCFTVVDDGTSAPAANISTLGGVASALLGAAGGAPAAKPATAGPAPSVDYYLIPTAKTSSHEMVNPLLAGAAGNLVGGTVGTAAKLAEKLNVKTTEASVSLALASARTNAQLYAAEGSAKSNELEVGGGNGISRLGSLASLAGGGNLANALGGGYGDSDTGKVVSAAYLQAFNDLVHHMQGQAGAVQAGNVGGSGAHVTAKVIVRARPSVAAKPAFRLPAGGAVFPTGKRNGVWMEIDDAAGHRGWIQSTLVN